MREPAIALTPRIRTSPFFDATVAAGVTAFTVYNHMYMPVSYGDPEGEYWRLIEGVSLWDVAAQRQVEMRGRDSNRLVDLISARDLRAVPVGRARYAPVCDHEGRLLSDPVMLRVGEDAWWMSISDGDLLTWCRALAAERMLEVEVSEPDVSPLAVQGPRSQEVMVALVGDWVDDLRRFEYRPHRLAGIPLWIGRAGWSGQGGFELYLCDGSRGGELWDLVAQAGAPFGIGPGAPNTAERLESGLLSVRTDTDEDTDPLEAGLDRWLDLDRETEFVGHEALVAKQAAGPARRRVGVILSGEPLSPNLRPWPARVNGEVVGEVRVAVHSPRLGCNIGTALLAAEHARPGTELRVEAAAGVLVGTVAALPLIN